MNRYLFALFLALEIVWLGWPGGTQAPMEGLESTIESEYHIKLKSWEGYY